MALNHTPLGRQARLATLTLACAAALVAGCASKPAPALEVATAPPVLASQAPGYSAAPAPVVEPVAPVSPLTQIETNLTTAANGTGVQVSRLTDGGVLLRASGEAAFASGKTTLSPTFSNVMQALAGELQAHPQTSVSVTGHTDSVGSAKANDRLSLARARAAQSYLVAQGVAAARVSAEGRGSRDPIAGNNNAEGRAANRRVDILLSAGSR